MAALALAAGTAQADTANGDMSDRGGDSFEMLAGQSWVRYDLSDAAFFEHFLGPSWRCELLREGCALASLPAPVSPVPEPPLWALLAAGLTVMRWRASR